MLTNVDPVAPLLGLFSSNIEISAKIGIYSIHSSMFVNCLKVWKHPQTINRYID